ncbi:hypothetical protein G6F37_006486 [Rhizopus arrhizus]|nr:hypothetical protein G6F38_003469 [Rhizopus arrhizus]KAG1157672.1 hypothetical protein G6F37_006486 [Rhizopus arrhizus]
MNTYSTDSTNKQYSALKSLKCVFCNEYKPLDAFSQNQIAKGTYNPYISPSHKKKFKTVTCKKCASSQNTHLTCMICAKTQPLEKFAKLQRRNAEKARCMKCIKKREEEDVWASESDTESEKEFDFL